MKLIVVTSSKKLEDEEKILTSMFEEGLSILHFRKPHLSTAQADALLKKIPRQFHSRIILHYHHILAAKYDLMGIHYSDIHLKKSLKYFWVRFRLRMKMNKIYKCHTFYSLKSVYETDLNRFDYCIIANLFNNITGEFLGNYTKENIHALIKNTKVPWVARGGATPLVIPLCFELGFWGIAFQSYIWKHSNPLLQFRKIQKSFEENKIPFGE
jgi:thiamine-phosphate pyrophosphorylase